MAFTWATDPDAVVVEPPSGLKLMGYVSPQKPSAGHINWLFQQLGELSQKVIEIGNQTPTFDAFGNLVSITDGPNTITLTYGAYGQLVGMSSDTAAVSITRDDIGAINGISG